MADSLLAVPHSISHPHISPHGTFQGYVTVSEINELYSQLGGDPKPAPHPTPANASPESTVNPSPDDDTPKQPEDEVCVVALRARLCKFHI